MQEKKIETKIIREVEERMIICFTLEDNLFLIRVKRVLNQR